MPKQLPIIKSGCCTPMVAAPLTEAAATDLARGFKALGDPVRLRLLSMIAARAGGEVCVCELTGAFDVTGPTISHHLRVLREAGLIDCERRGTWVLILLIFALARSGRSAAAPLAVGGYIGAAYWFTSSTSFANPAATIGRAFTGTFAGIAPGSVPGFVGAQLVGGLLGLAALALAVPATEAGDTGSGVAMTAGAAMPAGVAMTAEAAMPAGAAVPAEAVATIDPAVRR